MLTHRNDLATHSYGLVSGVAEVVSINGDGLASPLISPSCVVPAVIQDRQTNTHKKTHANTHGEREFRRWSDTDLINLGTLKVFEDHALILETVTVSVEIHLLE